MRKWILKFLRRLMHARGCNWGFLKFLEDVNYNIGIEAIAHVQTKKFNLSPRLRGLHDFSGREGWIFFLFFIVRHKIDCVKRACDAAQFHVVDSLCQLER